MVQHISCRVIYLIECTLQSKLNNYNFNKNVGLYYHSWLGYLLLYTYVAVQEKKGITLYRICP